MALRLALLLGLLCFGLVAACGEDENVCQQALNKINECRAALNPPVNKMSFPSTCSDDVMMTGSAGPVPVALKSWSEKYLECEIDTVTCQCNALGSWFDYVP
jgi:hypothetical protein